MELCPFLLNLNIYTCRHTSPTHIVSACANVITSYNSGVGVSIFCGVLLEQVVKYGGERHHQVVRQCVYMHHVLEYHVYHAM